MQNVRCLIAGIPQLLLADIMQNLAEESADIEIVDRVNTIEEVSDVLTRCSVDVLILGMDDMALPDDCVEMMNRVSSLSIVGLVNDGRQLAVYINNFGKSDITEVFSLFRKLNQDKTF